MLNRNGRLLKSMFMSMHSILVCAKLTIASMWRGMESPLRCNGNPTAGCLIVSPGEKFIITLLSEKLVLNLCRNEFRLHHDHLRHNLASSA